jgi:hypothetical protein
LRSTQRSSESSLEIEPYEPLAKKAQNVNRSSEFQNAQDNIAQEDSGRETLSNFVPQFV